MASITLDSTLVASDIHTTTTIEDELVIFNTQEGLYQGLNGIGPRVWELLEEPKTVRTLRDTLAVEYDVSTEQCQRDLIAFLEEMAATGLVEIEDGPD